MEDQPSSGQLLRARRRAHGLSQERLALRARTTQAAVSRIERGEVSPSLATLTGLLGALGEELGLSARATEVDWDRDHLDDMLRRTPEERLSLAIGWNRLAGELAQAGREARSRHDPA
jgi:transcriptional regulator with XRE-family HTH domain